MVDAKKRTISRKTAKAKASGQRSLLDHFPLKASSKRSSPVASTGSTESEGDAETLHSSDVELIDAQEPSSSPRPADVDCLDDRTLISQQINTGDLHQLPLRKLRLAPSVTKAPLRPLKSGSFNTNTNASGQDTKVEGKSRDLPIIIDSSPSKPSNIADTNSKPVYSIFDPRKSTSNLPKVPPPFPSAAAPSVRNSRHKETFVPFPDHVSQHVRGPQSTWSIPALPPCLRSIESRPPPYTPELHPSLSGSMLAVQQPEGAYCAFASHNSASSQISAATSPPRVSSFSSALPDDTLTPSEDTAADTFSAEIHCLSDSSNLEPIINDIPASHRLHPAIQHLLEKIQAQDQMPLPPSHELWTDKWRPRRADEVLGNEDRALYLRAWLLALKLHIESNPITELPVNITKAGQGPKKKRVQPVPRGNKRPQVLRRVDRRRKRRRLDSEEPEDSWIVDDLSDSATDFAGHESEDDLAFCQQNLARLQRAPLDAGSDAFSDSVVPPSEAEADTVLGFSYSPPDFGNQIHNTILLHGPSGCGKTAAVYACAEELGWDVFEVYPGIGERNGVALNKLIGDVGKNHLVKQTQRQQKTNIFGIDSPKTQSMAIDDTRGHSRVGRRGLKRIDSRKELENTENVAVDMPSPTSDANVASHNHQVSQSIVLVEEVDILYESDTNFWPALINIIKDCRRPVVLTCNDVSLIPVNDLPLQEILTFTACPNPLITSYLQCVSLAENRPLNRSVVTRLFEREDEEPCADVPSSGLFSPVRHRDLRGSLSQLQFGELYLPSARTSFDESGQVSNKSERWSNKLEWLLEHFCGQAAEVSPAEDEHDLRVIQYLDRYQDIPSFVDCYLDRRIVDVLADSITADSRVVDDELGYTILREAVSTSELILPVNQTFYHQDELIAQEAMYVYQHHLRSMCYLPTDLRGCVTAAQEYATQMVAILEELHVPSDILNSASAFLDYGPWVRYMVALDDATAVAYSEAQATKEGTRKTRNSQKSVQPVRYVPIGESSQRTLMRTALLFP